MKQSEVVALWDILHVGDVGTLAYCELEAAIEKVTELELDLIGTTLPVEGGWGNAG